MADPQSVFDEAVRFSREGNVRKARKSWQRLIDSGDPEWTERARVELGLLLKKQGDLPAARVAFEETIRSGDTDWAPLASSCLGDMMQNAGDTESAITAYKRAVESGHADWAPRASNSLGKNLMDSGDIAGAQVAFHRAIDSQHAEAAPQGLFNLGVLLKDQGDDVGAQRAYQEAIDTGHAEWAPMAANNLGHLLMRRGDLEGARLAFHYALDSGNKRWSQAASKTLELIRIQQSDPERLSLDRRVEQTWDGNLRQGERVVLDTTVVTPSFKKVPVSITITDQRLRFGRVVFDLGQITSCSCRQWTSKDDYTTIKITHATRYLFAVTGLNGKRLEIEFAHNYKDNAAVWSRLAQIAKATIEPRLVQDVIERLRSGNKYWLNAGDGRVLLEVTSEAFMVLEKTSILKHRASDRKVTVPWSEYAGVTYNDESGTLNIARPGLNPLIKCDSWHAKMMDACAQEFASRPRSTL